MADRAAPNPAGRPSTRRGDIRRLGHCPLSVTRPDRASSATRNWSAHDTLRLSQRFDEPARARDDSASGVSELSIGGHRDDVEDAGCAVLLALHRVRGHLERLAPPRRGPASTPMAMTHDVTTALTELVAALDRRVPRPERRAERSIARDSAALRTQAVTRLAELTVEERIQRRGARACPHCGSVDPILSLLTSMVTYFACRQCGHRWQAASN